MVIGQVTYELYIGVVTLIALAVAAGYFLLPLPQPMWEVLKITDSINALVLLLDFFVRLRGAPRKLTYLLKGGMLDALSGLPGSPWLRLLRLPRLVYTLHWLPKYTPHEVRLVARSRLAESTLFITAVIMLVVTTLGSMGVVMFEMKVPESNIHTGQDAVWWSLVTMATVGYGDYYPVTHYGRAIGIMLMLVGISMFSVLTSYIASSVLMAHRQNNSEIILLRREMAEMKQLLQQIAEQNSRPTGDLP